MTTAEAPSEVPSEVPSAVIDEAPAADQPPPGPPGSQRLDLLRRWAATVRRNPLQALVLSLPVLIVAYMAWARRWNTEDAFINFRIIDQIFAGNGPVFNAGVRTEASTSTAWLYLLVVERALFGWLIPVEWLAVLSGLALTGIGFIGITVGSVRLQRASRRDGFLVPAGALALVAVPPLWEYSTSGLENAMVFAWIGGCFSALTRRAVVSDAAHQRPSPLDPWWLPVLVGLGPLIRPELAFVTVTYWVAFWMLSSRGWRARAWSAVAALALPVIYQLFRMGYYATMVPNTALAKEGTALRVGHGWQYLMDFARPYLLVVPMVACALLAITTWRFGRDRRMLAVAIAPVVGGLLYGLYVVAIGGDYMHGRMMLGPFFAVLAPIAVVALPKTLSSWQSLAAIALAGVVVVWAVVAGTRLRSPHSGLALDQLTADERGFWIQHAGMENPVTVEDYYKPGSDEFDVIQLDDSGRDVFYHHGFYAQPLIIPLPQGSGVWAQQWTMGIVPYRMGTEVNYTDIEGLVDPVGARLRLPPVREQRPGHEKNLIAPFAAAELGGEAPDKVGKAAMRIMTCGQVAKLQAGVRESMTPSRFFSNIFDSPANTRLRISGDVFEAEREICGDNA